MPSSINAFKAEQSLKQSLKDDAEILKSVTTLFAFAALACSGEPFSLATGITGLIGATASALSGSSAIISKLGETKENKKELKSPYDRFCLLFFVTCQRCYIEALKDFLENAGSLKTTKQPPPEQLVAERNRLTERLRVALANLNEAEVSFRFCVDPMAADIPLFDAFDSWLSVTLEYFGYTISGEQKEVKACSVSARARFRVWIAQDSSEAQWMRNYLAITRERSSAEKQIGELGALHEVLKDWVEISKKSEKKRIDLWREYKSNLSQLPDQKESMFNENFGVRKVFVTPPVTYHIAAAWT